MPQLRFTPTRVGTTYDLKVGEELLTVHPHACGDDDSPHIWACLYYGSPPRVWGRQGSRHLRLPPQRFTPTRVGTTQYTDISTATKSVHPHACGDDRMYPFVQELLNGSPPRVWGRRHLPAPLDTGNRFTPTRVGTTNFIISRSDDRTVHPHACGDDSKTAARQRLSYGSPPRVWG